MKRALMTHLFIQSIYIYWAPTTCQHVFSRLHVRSLFELFLMGILDQYQWSFLRRTPLCPRIPLKILHLEQSTVTLHMPDVPATCQAWRLQGWMRHHFVLGGLMAGRRRLPCKWTGLAQGAAAEPKLGSSQFNSWHWMRNPRNASHRRSGAWISDRQMELERVIQGKSTAPAKVGRNSTASWVQGSTKALRGQESGCRIGDAEEVGPEK